MARYRFNPPPLANGKPNTTAEFGHGGPVIVKAGDECSLDAVDAGRVRARFGPDSLIEVDDQSATDSDEQSESPDEE